MKPSLSTCRYGLNAALLLFLVVGPALRSQSAIVARPNGTIYGTYLPATTNELYFSELHFMILAQRNAAVVQAQSDADNHTIVTANSYGDFQVWVYANDFLGYVEPSTGTLLYCRPLTVFGQEQPLLDAWSRGWANIQDDWVYPGTTQRIKGTNGILYYANGSKLRNEAGRWQYAISRREIDLPVGSLTGYDDREDYFFWHNGQFINHPVTKDRNYVNGESLVDPTPDPEITPINRPLRYEGGALFATGLEGVHYADGSPLVVREPGKFLLKYPPPNASVNLSDVRPGSFVQLRYANGDVLKQDLSPWNAQLRRTDGTLTTGTSNAFGFPGGISVYVSANANRDFIGIYREQANSVAAFLQIRQPPENPRNLRLQNLSETSVTVAWDPDPAGNNIYRLAIFPRGASIYDCGSGPDITQFTATVNGLSPDTQYTVRLCQQSAHAPEYFQTAGTLDPVSTKLAMRFERVPSPLVTSLSNSAGERYRLESAVNLFDWTPTAPPLTSSSTNFVLRWPVVTNPEPYRFYRVKKLTPFETE
jgi:hypothetical protein